MTNDIRQSPPFARFMADLGWEVEKIGSSNVYLRKFPLIGYFAKIPRIKPPISYAKIIRFAKNHQIFRLKIAPFVPLPDTKANSIRSQLFKYDFKIEHSPFNPTATIHIDLTRDEDSIFNTFTQVKRRGVRRAIKNEIIVKESDDIDVFIAIRKRQYFPMGFLMENEMRKLWKNFYPDNASLLLAYAANQPVGGIMLLFFDDVAYYWYASALPVGKKLFAPTLLVWEALKLAKQKGCKIFDFEGVYDERFPKAAASWRGFTKFKEGFGGRKVIYLYNFVR